MSSTPFFRLPLISFIVTFCLLLAQLIMKLNELNAQYINYHYSPDFMRIIGMGLLMLLSISISLNRIKIYQSSLRNIIFVIIVTVLALLLSYWLDIYLSDYFASMFDLTSADGYKNFVFWYPIISRICIIIIVFFTVMIITYLVKYFLHWNDEIINVDLNFNEVVKNIQIIYFTVGYLAVNFIFQRYLYIAVYMYFGNSDLPELHNLSFYLSSMMIAFLVFMYLKQQQGLNYVIDGNIVIKVIGLMILLQLIISIIVSFITIYAVQYYFVYTIPNTEIDRYRHYLALLYTMLNSIFAVAVFTCLLTYLGGRFLFKKITI